MALLLPGGWTRTTIVPYIAKPWQWHWSEIIVHHTWRPNYADWQRKPEGHYWVAAIDRVHTAKGWNGIGYHFVITPDGLIFVGRLLNQPGAHTVGHNHSGIGVCVLGNFDEETMTTAQYISLKYLLNWLCLRFNIPIDHVFFHRDFAPKTCPGKKLDKQELHDVLQRNALNAKQLYTSLLQERIFT